MDTVAKDAKAISAPERSQMKAVVKEFSDSYTGAQHDIEFCRETLREYLEDILNDVLPTEQPGGTFSLLFAFGERSDSLASSIF